MDAPPLLVLESGFGGCSFYVEDLNLLVEAEEKEFFQREKLHQKEAGVALQGAEGTQFRRQSSFCTYLTDEPA